MPLKMLQKKKEIAELLKIGQYTKTNHISIPAKNYKVGFFKI